MKPQKDPVREAEPEADAEPAPERESPPEPSVEELLAAERERYLRLAAEFENFRRRSRTEREALYAEAKADAAARFLTLYDNIARVCGDLGKDGDKSELHRVADMLKRQFEEAFFALGAEIISDESERGKPFDPVRHNAVVNVPAADDLAPGGVAAVVQSGLAVGGRIVKHADVAVTADNN